jgi:glycosyltransferase involved in cell wall biosynthesis
MDVVFSSLFLKILSLPNSIFKRYIFNRSEKIICSSLNYIKNSQIKNIYQAKKEKFQEIPFGVDIKKFHPIEKEKKQSKQILFVAGLDKAHYFKGLEVLIKSFENFAEENYELIIVGDGDLRFYYEEKAQKLKNSSKIIFNGKLEEKELIKAFQNTDLFVLPSINKGEAFGLVLLEAMACATPVIASRLAGV